jgi:hypothetical protein
MSRSAIAACLVASLAACRGAGPGPAGPDDSGEPLVAAQFVVLDSISAGVIPGATVLAGSRQGVTDAAGQVTLLVPRGPTQVSAFVAGYDAVTIDAFAPDGPRLILLRPSAPRVAGCRVSGSRLVAVASDFAGRKTILRRARSEVTLEGPAFGLITVPVLEWTWKAVDTWSYVVTVPLPAGELTRASWRVYDQELNVTPIDCDPRMPPGDR